MRREIRSKELLHTQTVEFCKITAFMECDTLYSANKLLTFGGDLPIWSSTHADGCVTFFRVVVSYGCNCESHPPLSCDAVKSGIMNQYLRISYCQLSRNVYKFLQHYKASFSMAFTVTRWEHQDSLNITKPTSANFYFQRKTSYLVFYIQHHVCRSEKFC